MLTFLKERLFVFQIGSDDIHRKNVLKQMHDVCLAAPRAAGCHRVFCAPGLIYNVICIHHRIKQAQIVPASDRQPYLLFLYRKEGRLN